jgi:hypothetical protein
LAVTEQLGYASRDTPGRPRVSKLSLAAVACSFAGCPILIGMGVGRLIVWRWVEASPVPWLLVPLGTVFALLVVMIGHHRIRESRGRLLGMRAVYVGYALCALWTLLMLGVGGLVISMMSRIAGPA